MTADEHRGQSSDTPEGGGPGEAALLARLAAIEDATRLLAEQTARLIVRVETLERRGGGLGAPRPSPPPAPGAGRLPVWRDAEAFIGRYGILALGTLTVLAAVGTFVRWAIAHGILGPTARVVLGLAFAAALALGGIHLRRSERSFGSTLLGLALAVTHVCAWAAGPLLHVVPDAAAFGLAAVASVVLAGFAHVEDDQPLWCVGFGGVAVAPFVTSAQGGSALLLALYGAMIGLAGGYALGARPWRVAEGVFQAGVGVYVAALIAVPTQRGPELGVWLPLIVATLGVLPFAAGDLVPTRIRPLGILAALAALFVAGEPARLVPSAAAALSLGAAGIVWLVLRDRVAALPSVRPAYRATETELLAVWIDAAIIPFTIVCAVFEAAPPSPWSATSAMAGGALGLGVFGWRRTPGTMRDAAAFAAAGSALAAVSLAPWDAATQTAVATAALGAAIAGAHRVRPTRSWVVMGVQALVIGSARAWWLLHDRAAYSYTPFVTAESAAAAGVLLAWAAAVALAPNVGGAADGDAATFARVVRAGAWSWAFLWAHRELAGAFSGALSTLSLVSLEAFAAVLAVGAGRAGDARVLRRVGLGLAIVAALRALGAAQTVESVGLRIASYLVASAFLLGIAFWYRGREGEPA